jgi:hypothetical protein
LAGKSSVLAAFDSALEAIRLLSSSASRIETDLQTLEDDADAGSVIEIAATGLLSTTQATAATLLDLKIYGDATRAAYNVGAETVRDVLDAITIMETGTAQLSSDVINLADQMRASLASVEAGSVGSLTQIRETAQATLQALDLGLKSALIAMAGDDYLANRNLASNDIGGLYALVNTAISDTAVVEPEIAASLGVTDPLASLTSRLDAASTALQDLIGTVETLEVHLERADAALVVGGDIAAIAGDIQSVIFAKAAAFDPLVGKFVADLLPKIDLSSLDLSLKAQVQGVLGDASDNFELVVDALLPNEIGSALEAIKTIDITPPDLSSLRYGALVGLSQINLKTLAAAVQSGMDSILSDASSATGVSILDQEIPLLGRSFGDLTGLSSALKSLGDIIGSAPDAGIAQLEGILNRAMPEGTPLRFRVEAPATLDAATPNRLSLVVEIVVPDELLGISALNLAEFTDFLGMPMPEMPSLTGVKLELTGKVSEQTSTLTLSSGQVESLSSGDDDNLREGDRLRVLDEHGETITVGTIRAVDLRAQDGSFHEGTQSAHTTILTVVWQVRDNATWHDLQSATPGVQIVREILNDAREVVSDNKLALDVVIIDDVVTSTPVMGAFRFDIDLRSVIAFVDGIEPVVGESFYVKRGDLVVARGTVSGGDTGRLSLMVRTGAVQQNDVIHVIGGSATIKSATVFPLDLVDEFSTRVGADLSLLLEESGSLFEFKTNVIGTNSVTLSVKAADNTPTVEIDNDTYSVLAKAALRMQLDDGLPDYSPIVPQFEASRLIPSTAIEMSAGVGLDLYARIDLGQSEPSDLLIGTALLSAGLKDGTITAPTLTLTQGDIIDVLTAETTKLYLQAEQAGAEAADLATQLFSADWNDIGRLSPPCDRPLMLWKTPATELSILALN